MILTLTASVMYWSLQQPTTPSKPSPEEETTPKTPTTDEETEKDLEDGVSNLTVEDATSESSQVENIENGTAPGE